LLQRRVCKPSILEAAAQRSKPQPAQTVPQQGSMEWFAWREAQEKKG
jgi:hypothetical protein